MSQGSATAGRIARSGSREELFYDPPTVGKGSSAVKPGAGC